MEILRFFTPNTAHCVQRANMGACACFRTFGKFPDAFIFFFFSSFEALQPHSEMDHIISFRSQHTHTQSEQEQVSRICQHGMLCLMDKEKEERGRNAGPSSRILINLRMQGCLDGSQTQHLK